MVTITTLTNFRGLLQGDRSGQLKPPVDLVPTVPAAGGPLLQQPTAQAGWRNIPNLSQWEVFINNTDHPLEIGKQNGI